MVLYVPHAILKLVPVVLFFRVIQPILRKSALYAPWCRPKIQTEEGKLPSIEIHGGRQNTCDIFLNVHHKYNAFI